MKKETKILIASVAVILISIIALYFKSAADKKAQADTSSAPQNLVRDFNHRTGPANAKVKIVEFYDPECEACAAFFPYVKEILEQYPNDIELTVRYALYHGNSTPAAKATEAAGRQGKYWEYQKILFETQGQWSHRSNVPMDLFEGYATNLGLNLEQFRKDMNDPTIGSLLAIDVADGQSIGVQGTPTFFINGVKLDPLHPNNFRERIESIIKGESN